MVRSRSSLAVPAALARRRCGLFVEEGARVVIADMQRERGEALAADIGDAVTFVACEVRQEDQVKATIEAAVSKWGRLDCMFNNAGFGGALGLYEEIPAEEFDMTFDVLVKGVFLGMKHAVPGDAGARWRLDHQYRFDCWGWHPGVGRWSILPPRPR